MFQCSICKKQHTKQAFISHASKDQILAQHIAAACCQGEARPFLFERERISDNTAPIADTIAAEIINSAIQFILLGPEVSNKPWTQAWIGYEIGISRGADRGEGKLISEEYFARKLIVIEDIEQSIQVCVPYLHVLLLFDYNNQKRWQELEDLVRFFADTIPTSATSPFYKAGNRLRSKLLITKNIKCSNQNCGSAPYEVWVFKEDISKLPSGIWNNDTRIATAKIKCPSCPAENNIELRPALFSDI